MYSCHKSESSSDHCFLTISKRLLPKTSSQSFSVVYLWGKLPAETPLNSGSKTDCLYEAQKCLWIRWMFMKGPSIKKVGWHASHCRWPQGVIVARRCGVTSKCPREKSKAVGVWWWRILPQLVRSKNTILGDVLIESCKNLQNHMLFFVHPDELQFPWNNWKWIDIKKDRHQKDGNNIEWNYLINMG